MELRLEHSFSLIKFAFEGDDEIGLFCDPHNLNNHSVGVSRDVYGKLFDYRDLFDDFSFHSFWVDDKEVGYYATCGGILVSFGINKWHRKRGNLIEFFNQITESFAEDFCTYMWLRNTRAINWLKKCGMHEDNQTRIDNVIKLNYTKCQ